MSFRVQNYDSYSSFNDSIYNMKVGDTPNKIIVIPSVGSSSTSSESTGGSSSSTKIFRYNDCFSLTSNCIISQENTNIILNGTDYKTNFNIQGDHYIYTGTYNKILLRVQLLYKWLDAKLPHRFILYVCLKKSNSSEETVFNTLIGVTDFLGSMNVFSETIPIEVNQNDSIYFKIFKNNDCSLQISKNSSIQIEYLS